MNTSKPYIRFVIYLLPAIAVAAILRQYMAEGGARDMGSRGRPPLHAPLVNDGPPTGAAVYHYAVNGGPTPPAAFTGDASRLCDGVMGDRTTGYTTAQDAGGANAKSICVLVDLGKKAPTVRSWEFAGELRGTTGNAVTLSATDSPYSGAWTPIDRVDYSASTQIASSRKITPAHHRYWLVQYQSAGIGASVTASDVRLMDVRGHRINSDAILPPGGRPMSVRRDFSRVAGPLQDMPREAVD